MNRLVIIDGHAILYRAFHALPPLTTSGGQLVNAVFGFISILLKVIHDFKPSHFIVTFDTPKETFRNKLFKGYQAKRSKMDEELIPQVEIVHKVVREMGIPIFEMDGYEADDVIGTIATRIKNYEFIYSTSSGQGIKNNNFEVIIVTGDRDLLQLVNDQVKVFMPVKGLSEGKLYGEKEVEEKFGIKPEQIIDYKALVGDSSDNYSGVAGIGPKTASTLLQRFKTLEQIYKQIDQIVSDKVRKALGENINSAEMAKKLATIEIAVPIDIDLSKCKIPDLDRPNIHHVLEELEFRSLIPRLGKDTKMQRSQEAKKQSEIKNSQKENPTQQIKLF